MPHLSRIILFPIKSLDGVAVSVAQVAPGGALVGDREFAIATASGRKINGKRVPKIMGLRAEFDVPRRQVALQGDATGPARSFHLDNDRAALEDWLSHYFEEPVHLEQNLETGFPDDLHSPGPTLVTEASLHTVTRWYPDLELESIRRRFRTNLEVAGPAAFWEDHLWGEVEKPVEFQIGDVLFLGTNPCQRCPVPTRDPNTGKPYDGFQKIFMAQRQASLPVNVLRSRFNHYYRFTINTKIPSSELGKHIRVGDELTLHS